MQTVFRGRGKERDSHELLKFCGQKEKWENVPIGIEVVAGYAIKIFSFNSAALFPCPINRLQGQGSEMKYTMKLIVIFCLIL